MREWFLQPVLCALARLEKRLMATMDEVNAAVEAQYDAVMPALVEQRDAFVALKEAVANGVSGEDLDVLLAD